MLDYDDDKEGAEDGKEQWEMLGLEKRIDYENLQRVFERLDLNVRIEKRLLSLVFLKLRQSAIFPPWSVREPFADSQTSRAPLLPFEPEFPTSNWLPCLNAPSC